MMNTQKKQSIKRFTYICLSFTSMILSTEIHAMDLEDESVSKSTYLKSNVREGSKRAQKYNLRGISLAAGNDFISGSIRHLTGSKFSHVGIILSDAEDERKWYCLESTGSTTEVLNLEYPHVRVTPWEEVVRDYDGKMSYRLFVFDDDKIGNSKGVTDFVEEYDNKLYTKNPLKLIKAVLGMNEKPHSTCLKTAFCSELAAKMLMDLDIIPVGTPGNFLPKHFSTECNIFLKGGIELTPEFKEKVKDHFFRI